MTKNGKFTTEVHDVKNIIRVPFRMLILKFAKKKLSKAIR